MRVPALMFNASRMSAGMTNCPLVLTDVTGMAISYMLIEVRRCVLGRLSETSLASGVLSARRCYTRKLIPIGVSRHARAVPVQQFYRETRPFWVCSAVYCVRHEKGVLSLQ